MKIHILSEKGVSGCGKRDLHGMTEKEWLEKDMSPLTTDNICKNCLKATEMWNGVFVDWNYSII